MKTYQLINRSSAGTAQLKLLQSVKSTTGQPLVMNTTNTSDPHLCQVIQLMEGRRAVHQRHKGSKGSNELECYLKYRGKS